MFSIFSMGVFMMTMRSMPVSWLGMSMVRVPVVVSVIMRPIAN